MWKGPKRSLGTFFAREPPLRSAPPHALLGRSVCSGRNRQKGATVAEEVDLIVTREDRRVAASAPAKTHQPLTGSR